jgi:hypothetical protein
MSKERCIDYANRAIKIISEENLPPGERALVLSSLAQVEATLELLDQFKKGIKLESGDLAEMLDTFSMSADKLARRLGDLDL